MEAGDPDKELAEAASSSKVSGEDAAMMAALMLFMVKQDKTAITYANVLDKFVQHMPDANPQVVRTIARVATDYYTEMLANGQWAQSTARSNIMQLKFQAIPIMSTGADGSGDLGKVQTPGTGYEVSTVMYEGNTRTYRVPNATTNQTVDLAGLASVEHIVVKTDKQITLRLNGTISIPIKPPTGFAFGYLFLSTTGITAMDVSNASGDTAVVVVQLGGDV